MTAKGRPIGAIVTRNLKLELVLKEREDRRKDENLSQTALKQGEQRPLAWQGKVKYATL